MWELLRGEDGDDGKDGVSVVHAHVDEPGYLHIELSDGRTINAGFVRGLPGEDAEVDVEAIIRSVRSQIPEVDVAEVAHRVLALIPTPSVDTDELIQKVRDAIEIPEITAEELGEKILASGVKFTPDFIEGLEELLEEFKRKLQEENLSTIRRNIQQRGGPTQFLVKSNGAGVSRVDSINFVNATVTATGNGTNVDVSFSGGGGGTNIETPSGTVNGVNTAFTVSNTPVYINVDGLNRFSGVGYSYAGGTITITDGAPPTQYIRSFY